VSSDEPLASRSGNLLLPVLPLKDLCLFPEASLIHNVERPAALKALEVARRTGGRILALSQKDARIEASMHGVGTLAEVADDQRLDDGTRGVDLNGLQRGRVVTLMAGGEAMVAEVELLQEGDPGDEWGAAVEALARYMHAHAELRVFLDQQRRSTQPMAWVNLACQHLPITASARQKLLDSDAAARCLKIGRGLDALLRKEQSA
jgi:ATP-dependent Lon protease